MTTPNANDFQKQREVASDLLTSAENGDLKLIQETIKKLFANAETNDMNEIFSGFKDAHKRTALHFAAARGRDKVITYILSQAPNCVNVRDEEGSTPLWQAAKENHLTTAKILLEHKADANISNMHSISPLHLAAASGNIPFCQLLIDHHADVNAVSLQIGTPLHFAVTDNQPDTISFLVNAGADINLRNRAEITPLILSCLADKPDATTACLKAQANPIDEFMGGFTALHIAANSGNTEIVKVLLSPELDESTQRGMITAANTKAHGATPLQLAAGMEFHELVEILKPVTEEFKDMPSNLLIIQEKEKLPEYHKAAANHMAKTKEVDGKEEESEISPKSVILPSEDDIIIPTAVEIDDDTLAKASALKQEGNNAFIEKNYEQAIEKYSQAIELNPLDAIYYNNRAAAYLGNNEAMKGLHDARMAKKLKPKWVKAFFREGQCLEALGFDVEAACALWEAVQLTPEDKLLEKRFQQLVARAQNKHKKETTSK